MLQLNLGRGRDTQNLLMQVARERRADVLLISEQYRKPENSVWFQDASRRAGIVTCNPDLGVAKVLETDRRFVWVELAGVRVYSCYFSPCDPFDIFESQILALEESLHEAVGQDWTGGESW